MSTYRAAFTSLALILLAKPVIGQVPIQSDIDAWGDTLRGVLVMPPGATADDPVPACVVVHGSGGLLRENAPGQQCGPQLESNFEALAQTLSNAGVATLLVSSFDSRDFRFCEDTNDDYFQFAPAPFFNPGDGAPVRDDAYSTRRIVIRTYDVLTSVDFLCKQEGIDCNRTCLIGASNGGSAVLSYVANDLQRHLPEFTDTSTQRVHESNSSFVSRQAALANLPTPAAQWTDKLAARTLPRFAMAIAPGCHLRALVPTVQATDPGFDPVADLSNLYYPAADVELHIDAGTADDVPEQCVGNGVRAEQAAAFEVLTQTSPSRFLVEMHEGAGHDLLAEREMALHGKVRRLVREHFFPPIFQDGFE